MTTAPMTSDAFLRHLESRGLEITTSQHPPVRTVDEAKRLRGTIPGAHAKNLFLKDAKGQLWLVVAREDRSIDLKELARRLEAKRFSFANADLLREVLGVDPGAVTPFGLINDTAIRVRLVLDRALAEDGLVNFHPLTNTATTTIAAADLLSFLSETGHEPIIADL